MEYKTYAEVAAKVRRDLGLEQEDFVTDTELMDYCNAGIDEAEAEIHTIYEGYFLTKAFISLVDGTEVYDLPANIYANKIRGLVYINGNTIYQVDRIHGINDIFEEIARSNRVDEQFYRYILRNDSVTSKPQMQLVPNSRETLSNGLTIWYLRNANKITATTDSIDIPEFVQFIQQFMKVRCYEKEAHPNLPTALAMLENQRRTMVSTLSNMVPDGDNEIRKDLTFYWETV